MEFLKKHYEKIVLGVVLAGLLASLVFLPFYIAADKQKLTDLITSVINPSVNALPDLDLSAQAAVATRLSSPFTLDLETGNKVFNPFEWQKSLDGKLIMKDTSTGAQMAVVTNIIALCLVLSLDSVITNDLGATYVVGIEKQASAMAVKRRKTLRYLSAASKSNDTFSLVEVKGAADYPEALVVKLVDSGELATILRGQPFQRVDAYVANLSYPPEQKVFFCRVNDKIAFGGSEYVVQDISKNELILVDQSNQKKTSLPFAP